MSVARVAAAPRHAAAARAWYAALLREPFAAGSILVHAPSGVHQAPGGGENQLFQTSRQLERLGWPVRPFCPWTDRLKDARLLHLYGMSREGLELARIAKALRVPLAVSPICWFEPRALVALAPNRLRASRDLLLWVARRACPVANGWRAELLALADRVLPNSRAEARQLGRLFGLDPKRVAVVPNGVDPRFGRADPGLFRGEYGCGDFVLYVGRVEPRKNVLGLIDAVRRLGVELVIIGAEVPGHERYADQCRRAGQGFVRRLPALDHADPMLASAYAAARVFALPSWFETPGLAALEAALSGCRVVLTPNGCTREYFGDRVEYARPDRPRRIAEAIGRAWERPADPELKAHVAERFSWQTVAHRTAEAYAQIAP
jgi:glycosyltransferase involved in cell wall biosynthesis